MPDLSSYEQLMEAGVIKRGNDPDLLIRRLPLGIPALDNLLGGGLPMGRCVQFYGPESTGKTLIAQYAAAAVQRSENPDVLYIDLEQTFDPTWWTASGVDADRIMVSSPPVAEQAIDIMRSVLNGMDSLGLIILDSIAGMVPAPDMNPEKSSEENKQPGMQAKVVTQMYRQVKGLLQNRVVLLATNQMRDNIGGFDELAALPGGRAARHYNHIIWRTRRDSWIKSTGSEKHNIGFYMELTSKKNKVSGVADGTSVTVPFLFDGQIDMLTAYIEEALRRNIITKRGPYFRWNEEGYLGIQKLRTFFLEHPDQQAILEEAINAGEV